MCSSSFTQRSSSYFDSISIPLISASRLVVIADANAGSTPKCSVIFCASSLSLRRISGVAGSGEDEPLLSVAPMVLNGLEGLIHIAVCSSRLFDRIDDALDFCSFHLPATLLTFTLMSCECSHDILHGHVALECILSFLCYLSRSGITGIQCDPRLERHIEEVLTIATDVSRVGGVNHVLLLECIHEIIHPLRINGECTCFGITHSYRLSVAIHSSTRNLLQSSCKIIQASFRIPFTRILENICNILFFPLRHCWTCECTLNTLRRGGCNCRTNAGIVICSAPTSTYGISEIHPTRMCHIASGIQNITHTR